MTVCRGRRLRSEGAGRVLSRQRHHRPASSGSTHWKESLTVALEITSARPDPALFDLPWSTRWRTGPKATSPPSPAASRGTSSASSNCPAGPGRQGDQGRHRRPRVRHAALLVRMDLPCVTRSASSPGAIGADGEPLDACLITRHLQFSLPYRALYSQALRPTPPPPHRRPRRPARQAAPRRVLVGRRLAVQHPVPPRCRRVRGIPRRRRDRRAARAALRRSARARPRDRAGQHRR
jgi:hypothetical protein